MPYLTCPDCRFSLWQRSGETPIETCPRCLSRRGAHAAMEVTSAPGRRFLPPNPRKERQSGAVLEALRRSKRAAFSKPN